MWSTQRRPVTSGASCTGAVSCWAGTAVNLRNIQLLRQQWEIDLRHKFRSFLLKDGPCWWNNGAPIGNTHIAQHNQLGFVYKWYVPKSLKNCVRLKVFLGGWWFPVWRNPWNWTNKPSKTWNKSIRDGWGVVIMIIAWISGFEDGLCSLVFGDGWWTHICQTDSATNQIMNILRIIT